MSGWEAHIRVFTEYTLAIISPAPYMYSRTQPTDPHQCLINDTICLPDRQQLALVFMISSNCASFSRLALSISSSISSRLLGYQIIFKPSFLWHPLTEKQVWHKSLLTACTQASFAAFGVHFHRNTPVELDILIIYAHGDLLQPHAQVHGLRRKKLAHDSLVDRRNDHFRGH